MINNYDGLLKEALAECVSYWDGYFGEQRTVNQLYDVARIMIERGEVFPETVAIYQKHLTGLLRDQDQDNPLKGLSQEVAS